MTARTPIGFLGLGVMGAAMAGRLLAAGHDVTVFNRTRHRAEPLARRGARIAGSPRALAVSCRIVVGCLLDTAAVESVHLGPDGLLSALRPGQIVVEHGTFAPDSARRLAAAAGEHGAHFLDVPVTGGPARAADGLLTGIAGGEAEPLDVVRPLLAAYCSELVHIGPAGSGLELKLINQLLVSVHVAAAGEAAALISRLGLPPEAAKQALMSGWAASTMLDYCLPAALNPSAVPSGATIGGLTAVQELVAALARAHGLSLQTFDTARRTFAGRVRAGAADLDLAQLARAYDPMYGETS
jgi:3-hydroxyisobutyrate dehydrogenase-like beta-hydroxyacid dehydrogenase